MKEQEKQIASISEAANSDNSKTKEEDIFSTTEIKIEEMAIDGICGVYQRSVISESDLKKTNNSPQRRRGHRGLIIFHLPRDTPINRYAGTGK